MVLLPWWADLPAFHILLSKLSSLSARPPALMDAKQQSSITNTNLKHKQLNGREEQLKSFCPYRVHGLLCFQCFSMLNGLHFLLVLPQHPATKTHQTLTTLHVFFWRITRKIQCVLYGCFHTCFGCLVRPRVRLLPPPPTGLCSHYIIWVRAVVHLHHLVRTKNPQKYSVLVSLAFKLAF